MAQKIVGTMMVDQNFQKQISTRSLESLIHIIKEVIRTSDWDTVDIELKLTIPSDFLDHQ